MCIAYFNKKIKKMSVWDIGLGKLAVAAIVLFIVSLLPVMSILTIFELKWLWLVLFIVFATKPIIKMLT